MQPQLAQQRELDALRQAAYRDQQRLLLSDYQRQIQVLFTTPLFAMHTVLRRISIVVCRLHRNKHSVWRKYACVLALLVAYLLEC